MSPNRRSNWRRWPSHQGTRFGCECRRAHSSSRRRRCRHRRRGGGPGSRVEPGCGPTVLRASTGFLLLERRLTVTAAERCRSTSRGGSRCAAARARHVTPPEARRAHTAPLCCCASLQLPARPPASRCHVDAPLRRWPPRGRGSARRPPTACPHTDAPPDVRHGPRVRPRHRPCRGSSRRARARCPCRCRCWPPRATGHRAGASQAEVRPYCCCPPRLLPGCYRHGFFSPARRDKTSPALRTATSPNASSAYSMSR